MDKLYSILREAGQIICTVYSTHTWTWKGIAHDTTIPITIFREKICLMITSSSKTFFGGHVDVDMRQELMKLRVSFDKLNFPFEDTDLLISQTPRRVIYVFFISSRFQFVPAHRSVLHFNLILGANWLLNRIR